MPLDLLILALIAVVGIVSVWRQRRRDEIDRMCSIDKILAGHRGMRPGDVEDESCWKQFRS